ncbi:MAG: Rieske 2Fe-2S domain-containing protein [Cyanobacteria bacterium P01_A01_bin.45]
MSTTVNTNLKSQPTPELFSWENNWYPVTFTQDFFEDKPYSFSLYDQPLILFRNSAGKLICLKNLCPHRAAKLSDGQLINGRVECLYHGWQFGTDGECLHIPQLDKSAKIPKQACIKSFPTQESQGIIWVWLGDKAEKNETSIPVVKEVEKTGLFTVDTVIDLPYDQDFLVENFLDPAHVPISHDRTELGMKREFAAPLEMEVLSSSIDGFSGRYKKSNGSQLSSWTDVEFIAPYLVKYKLGNESTNFFGGFALYAIPNGRGRCRVLVRRYGNFFSRLFRLTPRWLEHLRQNKLLEEDLPFIVEQQAHIEKTGKNLQEIYLPLKTSDTFVIEHRKWLDKYGQNLPYYQGYTSFKRSPINPLEDIPLDRLDRHTKNCSSCDRAYRRIQLFGQIAIALAIILAALAIVTEDKTITIVFVSMSLLSIGKFTILQRLKTSFENTNV